MTILADIKSKAEELLKIAEPYTVRETQSYDASKNRIIVAGFPLDGVVTSKTSSNTLLKQQTGIDYYYTAVTETLTERTLTVTLLPTASCLSFLRLLALRQLENQGWFNISVHENDRIVDVYRAFILDLPELEMSKEAPDRQIVFAIKTMHSGLTTIDEYTDTESTTYSKYGTSPDKGLASDSDFISETTGSVVESTETTTDFDLGYEVTPIVEASASAQ